MYRLLVTRAVSIASKFPMPLSGDNGTVVTPAFHGTPRVRPWYQSDAPLIAHGVPR